MRRREQVLDSIKVAAYHNDDRHVIRLYVENRISRAAMEQARADGQRAKAAGVRCLCRECATPAPSGAPPARLDQGDAR